MPQISGVGKIIGLVSSVTSPCLTLFVYRIVKNYIKTCCEISVRDTWYVLVLQLEVVILITPRKRSWLKKLMPMRRELFSQKLEWENHVWSKICFAASFLLFFLCVFFHWLVPKRSKLIPSYFLIYSCLADCADGQYLIRDIKTDGTGEVFDNMDLAVKTEHKVEHYLIHAIFQLERRKVNYVTNPWNS